MAFLDGGILGGSLKVGGSYPLEAKAKWEGTFANLQSSAPIDQCWEGMVVYVTDDKKHYKLTTKGVTSATNVWTEFGAGALNPLDYDLSEFTNTSVNPFVQQDELDDYIPLSGTEVDKPITGDLEVHSEGYFYLRNDFGSFFLSDDEVMGVELSSGIFEFNVPSIEFLGNSGLKGIIGSYEYDKQGDRKAFAQIADLEDALEDYIQEPTTDGTSGQVLTTDGSGGRSWTTVSTDTPTLQQVTDEGATTTNPIIVASGLSQVDINEDGTINATSNITGGKLAVRNTDGKLGSIFADNLTDDREHQLQDKDGTLAHLDDIETAGFITRTGTSIAFDKWATYDSYSSPSSGNYSYSLTSAVIGMVQVSYHEDTVVPTFTQAGIDVNIVGEYQPNIVNKIMFELIGATRVLINILPL